MNYYVLHCSEDGEVSLTVLTKEELEKSLADEDYDANDVEIPPASIYDFASGECPLVIIKGEAIKPIAKSKVSAWEVK